MQDVSLLPNAIEEMLRWTAPVKNMARTVTADTDFHGAPLEVIAATLEAAEDELGYLAGRPVTTTQEAKAAAHAGMLAGMSRTEYEALRDQIAWDAEVDNFGVEEAAAMWLEQGRWIPDAEVRAGIVDYGQEGR